MDPPSIENTGRVSAGARFGEGRIALVLRRIQAAGEIGPEADPDELATRLMAALQGGYMLAQVTRDIAPMDTAVFAMIDRVESFRPDRGPRGKARP